MRVPSPACRYIGAYVLSATLLCLTVGPAGAAQRKTLFYHPDYLGSATLVTDSQGAVVQQAEYLPYGATYRQSSVAPTAHQFTGQRLDASTGLYFYHARYYDPNLGRFVSADSIVQAAADPQTLNRYSYAQNNPTNRVDSSGHFSFGKWLKSLFSPFAIGQRMAGTIVPIGAQRDFQRLSQQYLPANVNTALVAAAPHLLTGNFVAAAVVAAAAVATAELLDTGEGRRVIARIGNEVFDDVLGFSPRGANHAAALTVYMAANAAIQVGLGHLVSPKTITGAEAYNETKHGDRVRAMFKSGGGINYGGRPGDIRQTPTSKVLFSGDRMVGATYESLALPDSQHIGIVLEGLHGFQDLPSPFESPMSAILTGYGTVGISHTGVNVSLLQAGYHTTITDLYTMPNVHGGWSTSLSNLTYGPYGGGLIGAVSFQQTRDD